MALVRVEVVDRALILSHGLTIDVGERISLDNENPEHAAIIKSGWVRECPPVSFLTASLDTNPNKMMRRNQAYRK
jgi:hypothetical protein